jgi:hypothetical protein
MRVCGKDVTIQGRVVRIARLDGEKHTFPDSPDEVIQALRHVEPV